MLTPLSWSARTIGAMHASIRIRFHFARPEQLRSAGIRTRTNSCVPHLHTVTIHVGTFGSRGEIPVFLPRRREPLVDEHRQLLSLREGHLWRPPRLDQFVDRPLHFRRIELLVLHLAS